jgi:hypothetical protein
MNIYQISQDLQAFFDSLPDTGELDEEALARYAELNDMTEDKLKSTCYAYLNLKSKSEAIASEIKRLTDLKKSNDSQMSRVEKLIDFGMGLLKLDKQDFGNVVIGYRKSVGTIVTDEDLVPDEYKKEKTVISVDLVKAKEVLKNGGEVAGVQLEERKNLFIK